MQLHTCPGIFSRSRAPGRTACFPPVAQHPGPVPSPHPTPGVPAAPQPGPEPSKSPLLPVDGGCSPFPHDSRRCAEPKQRFFYNATSQSCEPFVYHGCPGNRNRYHTIEECQRYCGQIEKPGFCPPSPRGALVPCMTNCLHDGSCQDSEKCCSFGCALRCMKPVTDLCQLPPEEGPCDLKLRRWFYDPKTQRCMKFVFGGCAGNANNFSKNRDCRLRCHRRGSP
ncbi:boophilin-H2-like isoform X2 [Erythrolamprus reginae]|uniref:boophilin-H2-like isoform X2 n=1 Tax=Erythrolamprus reginae TaxID=121349 RepID=UPI00396CC97A